MTCIVDLLVVCVRGIFPVNMQCLCSYLATKFVRLHPKIQWSIFKRNETCNDFKNKMQELQHKFQDNTRIVCQRTVGCYNLNLLWHVFERVDVSQQFFGQQLLHRGAICSGSESHLRSPELQTLVFHALSEWLY